EKNNKIIVGHWSDKTVQKNFSEWMVSAVGYIESHEIKVARFGDNMRNVAVTEGDKIEAAIQFGWRSEEHTSELQSRFDLVCRLLLEKKKIVKASSERRP